MKSNGVAIFGITDFARQIWYYLENNEGQEKQHPLFFVADDVYIEQFGKSFSDLPGEIVGYNDYIEKYSSITSILPVIGYNNMNNGRKAVFERMLVDKCNIASFTHETSYIAKNVSLGKGIITLENVVVEPFVKLGNANILWAGSCVCHNSVVGDYCFFASNSVVLGQTKIGSNCFIGANSTIRNNIEVSDYSLIGAGTFVLKNTISNSVVIGKENPLIKDGDKVSPFYSHI